MSIVYARARIFYRASFVTRVAIASEYYSARRCFAFCCLLLTYIYLGSHRRMFATRYLHFGSMLFFWRAKLVCAFASLFSANNLLQLE